MEKYNLTRWNFAAAYNSNFEAESDQAAILYAKRFIKTDENANVFSLKDKKIIYSKIVK